MRNTVVPQDEELLTQLYHGIIEPQPWHTFLQLLRRRLCADIAIIAVQPAPGALALTRWDCLSPQLQQQFESALDKHVRAANSRSAAADDPVDSTPASTRSSAQRQSDFYLKLMRAYGIDHAAAIQVGNPGGAGCFLAVLNHAQHADAGIGDQQLLAWLQPHLQQALAIYTQLQRSVLNGEIYGATLDRLTIATVILDAEARIVEISRCARSILLNSSCLTVKANQLLPCRTQYREAFAHMVQAAIDWQRRQMPDSFVEVLRIGSGAADELGLLVRSAPTSSWQQHSGTPSAIVHLLDFAHAQTEPAAGAEPIVARLFGLTKSEARLAILLANGFTLSDAALKLNLTESSVRTYSKKIFSKLGIGKQSDLVRIMLKGIGLCRSQHDVDVVAAQLRVNGTG